MNSLKPLNVFRLRNLSSSRHPSVYQCVGPLVSWEGKVSLMDVDVFSSVLEAVNFDGASASASIL